MASEKLQRCRAIWAEMPEAKPEEVAEAFEQRHGEACSLVTVRKARREKASNSHAENEPITADELLRLKQMAEADGGLDELDRRLQAVEAVVKHFYGLPRVRAVLDCLKELIG